jgi:hypothetical protein
MLKALSQDPQCKRLCFEHGFLDSEAIGQYPWKVRDFGKPTAIGFPFVLYADIHKDLGGEDFRD